MSGSTKALVLDVDSKPAPQYYDPTADDYTYLEGEHDRLRRLDCHRRLAGSSGTENATPARHASGETASQEMPREYLAVLSSSGPEGGS